MKRIVLASESPRRAGLLKTLGLRFEVLRPQVIERMQVGIRPRLLAERLAQTKAYAVQEQVDSGVIIAADTLVVLGDEVLGKPANQEEAREMLARLSGREHRVVTGICVIDQDAGSHQLDSEVTVVQFRSLNREEIQAYLETGEPMDKAGAYGIQGKGAVLVESIEGCYFNVVGLPLSMLYKMLKVAGVDVLQGNT